MSEQETQDINERTEAEKMEAQAQAMAQRNIYVSLEEKDKDMSKFDDYFARKEAEAKARKETEAMTRLMELSGHSEPPQDTTPEPQDIEEAINELKDALK